MERKAH